MKAKGQKGITLIALVITIIVLLILAGVAIATLSGNNSAPQKATEAAQKDAIAGAKDEIAMETQEALLNYYNNKYVSKTSTGASGQADVQSVVAEAAGRAVDNAKSRNKELEGSSVSGNTITLKTKSYEVTGTIDTNGGITWSDSNTGGTGEGSGNGNGSGSGSGGSETGGLADSTQSQLNGDVGKEVIYTAPAESNYSGTWRLLYADKNKNEAYIITTSTISLSGIPIGTIYNGTDDTETDTKVRAALGTYGTNWNQKWLGLATSTKLKDNRHKATAYLCDKANWSKYVAEKAPTGTYAVGGPTNELLAAAWEAKGYDAKWSNTVTDDVEATGYKFDKPTGLREKDASGNWTIKTSILPYTTGGTDGLFNNGTSYWLASPSSNDDNFVCYVDGSGSVDRISYFISVGVRPLVVVPLSKIQESSTQTGKLEVIMQE